MIKCIRKHFKPLLTIRYCVKHCVGKTQGISLTLKNVDSPAEKIYSNIIRPLIIKSELAKLCHRIEYEKLPSLFFHEYFFREIILM